MYVTDTWIVCLVVNLLAVICQGATFIEERGKSVILFNCTFRQVNIV